MAKPTLASPQLVRVTEETGYRARQDRHPTTGTVVSVDTVANVANVDIGATNNLGNAQVWEELRFSPQQPPKLGDKVVISYTVPGDPQTAYIAGMAVGPSQIGIPNNNQQISNGGVWRIGVGSSLLQGIITFAQGAGMTLSLSGNTITFTSTAGSPSILHNGTAVGSRPAINLADGGGVTWTVADDSTDNRVNVSATVQTALEVNHNGASVGTRAILNLIDGSNVTLTVADNSGTGAVDVTIASSGGGSTAWAQSIQALSGNISLTTPSAPSAYFFSNSAAHTVTLPAATAAYPILIVKTDSNSNAITVAANGSDQINGSATTTLASQFACVWLMPDGVSKWYIFDPSSAGGGGGYTVSKFVPGSAGAIYTIPSLTGPVFLMVDATSFSCNVQLPSPLTGYPIVVSRIDGSSNTVNLLAYSSGKIDSATTYQLSGQWASATLYPDDGNITNGDWVVAQSNGASYGSVLVPIPIINLSFDALAWSPGSALTEFLGKQEHRLYVDLTNASQARILVSLPGAPTTNSPTIACEYSTNGGVGWNYLDNSSGPAVSANTNGVQKSGWVNITSGAKTDVMLRIVALSGDGTSMQFGLIQVQVK